MAPLPTTTPSSGMRVVGRVPPAIRHPLTGRNFWCSIPPWRIVMHAAVTHVHACHSACNFDPLSRGIGFQN
jgi:hypothetical protein